MKKILVLLFILTAFQVYAFDVDNLNGASCKKVSDAAADGFDPDMWYEYECSFDGSVTFDSLYNDVLDNIEAAYNKKMIEEERAELTQKSWTKPLNKYFFEPVKKSL